MRTVYIWALLMTVLGSANSVTTQTNGIPASAKRFLFIVETSSATKASAANAQKLLSTLLESGMGGLMETGDTFGLWTFNQQLYSGQVPMQRWTSEKAGEQARQVSEFLKKQKFEKEPQMDPVLRPMYAVIRSSPTITVVLVTSGKKPMQGTPFDRDINEFYKEHYRDFLKNKTPFVTMLLAQEGEVLRHSVSAALGDVKIPKPLPPKPSPGKEQNSGSNTSNSQNKTAIGSSKTPAEPAKALVITKSGVKTVEGDEVARLPKPQPKAVPPANQANATNVAAAPPTEIVPAPPVQVQVPAAQATTLTNSVQEVAAIAANPPKTEEKTPEAKPVSKPQPPIEVAKAIDPVPSPAPPPAASPAPAPALEVPKPIVVAQAETNPKPAPATEPQREAIVAKLASSETNSNEGPVAAPAAKTPPSPTTSIAATPIVSPAAPAPATKPEPPAPATPPPAPIAPAVASAPTPNVAVVAPEKTATAITAPEKSTDQVEASERSVATPIAPAIAPAVAPTATASMNPKVYLIGGLALVVVAIITAFFIGRYTNRKPNRSLISDWANQNTAK